MSFIKIFTVLSLVGVLFANVSIIGPTALKEILKKIDGGGKLIIYYAIFSNKKYYRKLRCCSLRKNYSRICILSEKSRWNQ